jgi:ribosome biogenesis GTPase
MRLDRYRVQIEACGIVPLVVLNKADLVENAEQLSAEVREKLGCTVMYCSTYTGVGITQLNQWLEPRHTYLLIGSSGAGKSSLLNALRQNEKQKTGNLSDANHKGKHTTTTRDLFQLPNGSLVIDSPGMREFGLTTEDHMSADILFPKIMELAATCRFANCRHRHEPGCAVQKALLAGELDQVLYNSYIKLVKEQERFETRSEDKKRMEKQFGKITREAKKHRKKYKF